MLHSACGRYSAEVSAEFLSRNALPGREGYYVVEDGKHASFFPRLPFEDGYKLVE